ncbi:MAG: hypothetical protein IT281_07445 [Ignavibacteria bacterium]|nr:hypothetical protein [Ignavibacteria bacterium]MCC7159357.1 hypothetical protein [Ignavibacteria bacterium]
MKTVNTIRQNKLLVVLNSLSKKEYTGLGKLVRSQLFRAGRNLYPLYLLIGKYHPDLDSRRANENLTNDKIFEKLYPGRKYDSKRSGTIIRKLFSDLNKQAEEFLLLLALRNNPFEKEHILIKELTNRNLDASYKKHLRKIDGYLKTRKTDEYYFRQMADAENLKYNYNLLIKDRQALVTGNVIKKGEYNIINALLMLAEAMHDAGVNHRTFNSPYKETMIYQFAEKINYLGFIDYVKKESSANRKIAELCCYELLNILNPGNKEPIFKYKDLVIKNLHWYSQDKQKNLLQGIHSMMVNARLGKESFEVARFTHEKGLYHTDKTKPFPLIEYKNLIRGAIRNNEHKWTESFIETYHKDLSPEYQQDMFHYGRAYLQWSRGDYENVLKECSRFGSRDAGFVIDIKILTLMVYYEIKEFESAFSLIDSLNVFLKQNKKISREHDLYFRGFVKMTKRLLKCRMEEGRKTAEEITAELNDIKDIYAVEWLREKANELY